MRRLGFLLGRFSFWGALCSGHVDCADPYHPWKGKNKQKCITMNMDDTGLGLMIRVVIRVWVSTRFTETALIERVLRQYNPNDTGETGFFGKLL